MYLLMDFIYTNTGICSQCRLSEARTFPTETGSLDKAEASLDP
jgi:hypothetical protein